MTEHPQAELLRAIADGKKLELLEIKGPNAAPKWIDWASDSALSSATHTGIPLTWRVKPNTIRIGIFDVPEPLREAPSDMTWVYAVRLTPPGSCFTAFQFNGSVWEGQRELLRAGLLHLSSAAAELHARALISLTAS